MIKWVAQGVRHGFGPFLEFGKVVLFPGAIAFIDAIGSHGPPLVMIAVQPDLGQVVERQITGNLIGRQMTMVVDDRHRFGKLVVELLGRFRLQQKVVG